MIACLQCGHENRQGRRFCGKCRAELPFTCPACGFGNERGDTYCGGCGSALDALHDAAPVAGGTEGESPDKAHALEPAFDARPDGVRRGAEKRQLTVMLCDFVDYTGKAQRFDNEDLREVLRACQDAWEQVITELEGHVARYMGDGALVYFGYPVAHEDDAERAVQAGLKIIERMEELDRQYQPTTGIAVAITVGIATGPCLVGDVIGEGPSEEIAVVGTPPNLAARLQGVAPPNGLVIAQTTRELVKGLFEYEELGPQNLKGFDEPVPAWRVHAESRVDDRFGATHGDLTPLVGRDEQLEQLLARWRLAAGGEGQVALLVGQPGIGKSRLGQALREAIPVDTYTLARYFCTAYHQSSALYPIISHLERAAGIARKDPLDEKVRKLETLLRPTDAHHHLAAVLFASLMARPDEEPPEGLNMSPEQQRARTYEALERQLAGLASERPVLILFEDLHWSDPSTQEVLERVIRRVPALPVMMVLTYRPEFTPTWVDEPHVTTITLSRLSDAYGQAIVRKLVKDKRLPPEVMEQIVRKADGIPLFVEEVTKTVLESGFLREEGDAYVVEGRLPPMAVPSTLHDSLMARLDRLAPVRDVAQLGAVIGRQFPYPLLRAVSRLEEAALQVALQRLVEAELVYKQGEGEQSVYTFKHSLVRDAAYGSMLRSRRRYLHGRVADVLEKGLAGEADAAPEVLAHHLGQAGEAARAVHYFQEAGRLAIRRSAYREAAKHISSGLEYLSELGDGVRTAQTELELQLSLASSLTAGRNYADPGVEKAYLQAERLAQRLDDHRHLFVALRGLWNSYYVQGNFNKARQPIEKMFAQAQSSGEAAYRLVAHQALGQILVHTGEFSRSLEEFEQGISIADGEADLRYGRDSGVYCYAYGALALWCLGDPDRAVTWSEEAIERSRSMERPFIHVQTLGFAALLHALRRDLDMTLERSAETIAMAEEYVFPYWLALAQVVRGWALCGRGQHDAGIELMREGLRSHEQTGSMAVHTWFLALLAERTGEGGETDSALALLDQALAEAERNEERMWEAEIWRLRGEIQLRGGGAGSGSEAERSLRRALGVADAQGSRSWTLRVATSLAAADAEGALDTLAHAVATFPSDVTSPDLEAARALLEAGGTGR